MARKLASHNAICNEIYFKLQECENETPLLQVIAGHCFHYQKLLDKCVKGQRERQRAENRRKANERTVKLREYLQNTNN